ncbi:MAG: outer membrane protein assembly factor BamB family protein [Planctomycetota bacterium]|jgi:outer membrane protein assembly factor BamB
MFIKLAGNNFGPWLLVNLSIAVISVSDAKAEKTGSRIHNQLVNAGARIAWKTSLPLRFTDSIKSYHLIDQYLYALGTDGNLRGIRAHTGQHIWTKPIAKPLETIYPPMSYHTKDMHALAITRLTDVLILDPETADQLKRYNFHTPTPATVAITDDNIYAAAMGSRIFKYSISNKTALWQLSTTGPIQLAPLIIKDQLYIADSKGMVACIIGESKERLFSKKLDGQPRGWLAADEKILYVATADGTLHFLDRHTGLPVRRSLQLKAPPLGGTVITKNAAYQAIEGGGLYQVPLTHGKQILFYPDGRRFLADWPHHTVMLQENGKIALISRLTGKKATTIDVGQVADGISNLRNQAVIVYSARGQINCLLPIGSKPLTPDDFKPPIPEPKEKPVEEEKPTEEAKEETTPTE